MKHKLKILLSIIFVISISLTVSAKPNYSYSTDSIKVQNNYQGTYVNEEVDVPITRIGLPEQYTKAQTEEKGLEIVWNKWHANVRNKITEDIYSTLTPQDYIIAAMCTIDNNQNISDIIVSYFPLTALNVNTGTASIKKQTPFYVYMHTQKKYFKAIINSNELYTLGDLTKDEQEEVSKILANASFQEISYNQIPYYKFLSRIATKLEHRQGQSSLMFPKASKRKNVTVTGGVTDIYSIQTVNQYTADMFDDLEKY